MLNSTFVKEVTVQLGTYKYQFLNNSYVDGLTISYTRLIAVCDFNTLHLRNSNAQLDFYEKTELTLEYLQTHWAYKMNNISMKSHACHDGEILALESSSGGAFDGTQAQIVNETQWLLIINPS